MKKIMLLVAVASLAAGTVSYAGSSKDKEKKACTKEGKACCKSGGAKSCAKGGEMKSETKDAKPAPAPAEQKK